MRKAKGLLSIAAGLVLFQAGTSVAYAADGKHKAAAKNWVRVRP